MRTLFVTLVDAFDNCCVDLYGPYTYEEAIEVVVKILQGNKTQNGPIDVSQELREQIINDGVFEFDCGGGVFISEAGQYDEQEDS